MSVDINLITSQGYEVEQLDPNIYMVKNFLKEEEILEMWDIINNAQAEDWAQHQHYTKHLEDRAEELTGNRDVKLS